MFNRYYRFALEQPLLSLGIFLLLLFWGLSVAPFNWNLSFESDSIPVDAIPDLGENQQIVYTEWKGQSPEDIEDQITYPLSNYFLTLPGVKDVRGLSITGRSTLYIIFDEDVDFYWSRSRIIEKINSLPSGFLPENAKPALGPDATGLGQIFWYYLEGVDDSGEEVGGWDLDERRTLQDYYIKPSLSSVPGVSEVASIGGFVKEFQVDVHPTLLEQYQLSTKDVLNALNKAQAEGGLRTLEYNQVEYLLRGNGSIEDLNDLEWIPVRVVDQTPLYLKDIANITYGPADRRGVLDVSGKESVGGVVVAQYGANPKKVIEAVQQKIDELSPSLPKRVLATGEASQLNIIPFYDRSELIEETILTLESALWLQILITIAIVLLILRRLRIALLISLMLPVSVLLTFIAMKLGGVDANIVALSGIAIAIGTVVDMGVILTDTIIQHIDQEDNDAQESPEHSSGSHFLEKRLQLVISATKEVAGAIITAITTTIVSFLPVFLMINAEGKLFQPLAYTKTFVLAASILVALFLLPVLAYLLFGQLESRFSAQKNNINSFLFRYIVNPIQQVTTERRLTKLVNELNYKHFHDTSLILIILLVLGYLTRSWLPLGPEVSVLLQWIFISGLLLILIGSVLKIITYYPTWLAWSFSNKKTFISLPIGLVLFGLFIWLGFAKISFIPTSLAQAIGIDISKTDWWSTLDQEYPGLATEFMPSLDEGAFLFMPTTTPSAGVEQNVALLQFLDRAVADIPEVEKVVGKLGRVESALDPAPISMFENIITYKSEYSYDISGNRTRQWREHIKSPDDIWNEIVRQTQHPALTSAPKLQPIETRLLMLQTGLRAPVGIRIQGEDIAEIQEVGRQLEKVLTNLDYVNSATVFAERNASKPYIDIEWDREKLARYGMSVTEAQSWAQIALAGTETGTVILGRERFSIRLRFAKDVRQSPESIKNLRVETPQGARVPLHELAKVAFRLGPQAIKSEQSFKVSYVSFDVIKGVEYVDAISKIDDEINQQMALGTITIPDGIQLSFKGNFENQLRAEKRLKVLVPLTLVFIFLILYIQFKSVAVSLMIFSGIFVAWAGGFILLGFFASDFFSSVSLFGFNSLQELFGIEAVALSIAVWVGFLALFGIATDGGVVMATYLQQGFKEFHQENQNEWEQMANTRELVTTHIQNLRNVGVEAATKRIRPTMITTATTIFALLPLFSSMGKGSEIMVPMAIPTLGGMFVQIITLFVVPLLFIWREERKLTSSFKNNTPTKETSTKETLPRKTPPPALFIVCMLGIVGVGITPESSLQAQNTLNTYKLEALSSHPNLLSKWNEIATSEFQARSIGIMDPTVSIGVFAAPIETALGAQTARISINQSVPFPNSLKLQRLTLEALIEAREFGYLEEVERHFLEMDKEWASIYTETMRITFLDQQLDVLNELTQLLTTFNSEGYSTNRKILEIELQEKTLDQQREEAFLVRSQHVRNFNRLRNAPITDSLIYPERLETNVDSGNVVDGFDGFDPQVEWTYSTNHNGTSMGDDSSAIHLLKSPGIQRLQAIVESKKLDLNSAELSRYPSLGVGLDYISIAEKPGQVGIQNNGKDAVLAKVSFSLPITQKRKRAAIQSKASELSVSDYRFQAHLIEVKTALERWITSLEINEIQQTKIADQMAIIDELLSLEQQAIEAEQGDLSRYFEYLNRKLRLKTELLQHQENEFLTKMMAQSVLSPLSIEFNK
jgi:Cu(I)/Ag(I) efflux system membrane protein CusA/SilA